MDVDAFATLKACRKHDLLPMTSNM